MEGEKLLEEADAENSSSEESQNQIISQTQKAFVGSLTEVIWTNLKLPFSILKVFDCGSIPNLSIYIPFFT